MKSPKRAQQAKLKVLVVEDNLDSAESLAEVLRLWQYEPRLANDGPGAIRTALAFSPDVVLLDIGLPEMDGYEVAARLHAEPQLQKIPLVALTGYNPDKNRLDLACFSEYFTKPVDLDRLENFLAGLKNSIL